MAENEPTAHEARFLPRGRWSRRKGKCSLQMEREAKGRVSRSIRCRRGRRRRDQGGATTVTSICHMVVWHPQGVVVATKGFCETIDHGSRGGAAAAVVSPGSAALCVLDDGDALELSRGALQARDRSWGRETLSLVSTGKSCGVPRQFFFSLSHSAAWFTETKRSDSGSMPRRPPRRVRDEMTRAPSPRFFRPPSGATIDTTAGSPPRFLGSSENHPTITTGSELGHRRDFGTESGKKRVLTERHRHATAAVGPHPCAAAAAPPSLQRRLRCCDAASAAATPPPSLRLRLRCYGAASAAAMSP